ncbi:MAG: cupin domain-containing protein, partial [Beijerinckiaceae bacterium]|nr:cupin domain-containing protein [Beijerinckiaceae bacterium]
KEPAAIDGRTLRLRKLVVQPGGVVPWHSHADRPAIIYIVEGTIIEYASNCAVPIVHKTGEVARETSATSHWWKNASRAPVTLLSADVQHDESDNNM